jgi:hypothetical protein
MSDFDNEILRAYVRGVLSRERCAHDAQQLQEICVEHGFDYVDHSFCGGFCPECGQVFSCEAYEEINDEWDGFYT